MPRPSSRERLLDAAEQLFADRGLADVSLRAINAEAGLSPAALHYHFGSKEVLLEALLERRMPGLMEERSAMLDAIEAGPGAPSAREVLHALVRPLANLLAEEGEAGRRYVKLLARLWGDGDLAPSFVRARFARGVERLEPMLQDALPALPPSIVRLRMALAVDLLMRALAARDHASPPADLDDLVVALLDFSTGALEAPSHIPLERAHPAREPSQAGDLQ